MTFKNPEYLWLLLVIAPIIVWYVLVVARNRASISISSKEAYARTPRTYRHLLFHVEFALRIIAIALIVLCIARPQLSNSYRTEHTEGIDIIMTVDVSGTMLAEDFRPNRLEAAKDVATEFISDRPNDNIGLVVFAGESFTQCPLTTDHASLINMLRSVRFGDIDDGTAIGLGLATAINRIKESESKSKVIILLTDGSNNCGEIAPLTAAEIAKTFGIRVYTIGVGKQGMAPYPVKTPFGTQRQQIPVEIDEDILRQIAATTGGEYFRATDNSKLHQIYEQIDQLEKTKLRVREYSKQSEEYAPFMLAAIILLMLSALLRSTLLRHIP